ncbi:MAG: twin-arginine translocase TatA/TatE family subunit [Flavobacteriaceae bacterium]|nr:twin-arginine translocase TatA/TatE family subunit [Flavobacteriaceae bacterium]
MYLFISGAEIVIILLLTVMIFGSDKLPDVVRGLAKGLKTLRNATDEIKQEISNSVEISEKDVVTNIKEEVDNAKKQIEEIPQSVKRNLK